MCNPSAACVEIDGREPICTQYFSVRSSKIKVLNRGIWKGQDQWVCASGSFDSEQVCHEVLMRHYHYPLSCTNTSQCYSVSSKNLTSECTCSYPNTKGLKYCEPFFGDIPEYLDIVKSKIQKNFSYCFPYQFLYDLDGCGFQYEKEFTPFAPQVKEGTWGDCYNSINLTVFYAGLSNSTCPVFNCIGSNKNNPEGNCINYDNSSNVYIESCPNNYHCGTNWNGNYNPSSNVICERDRIVNLSRKGESCWVGQDCHSGMCSDNKRCIALNAGSTCTSDKQCDKGYKCAWVHNIDNHNDYTCQKWLEANEFCVYSTAHLCRVGLKCVSDGMYNAGTCQAYYSMSGGQLYYEVTYEKVITGTDDKMCEYGAIDVENGQCATEPRKLASNPLMCSNDLDCKSTITPSWYPTSDGSCLCFPNLYGQKFCKPFSADYDPDYFTRINKFYSQDFTQCFIFDIGTWEGCAVIQEINYNFWEKTVGQIRIPRCGSQVLYDEDKYLLTKAKDLHYQWTYAIRSKSQFYLQLFIISVAWNLLF